MKKILIANRGEIALRIIRSCKRLNISTVAVYSDADRHAPHVRAADEAYPIGPAPVEQSYLNQQALLAAAEKSNADAIHPGYGFLSENPDFASAVIAAGFTWIGPSADAMRKMASKISAREIAVANNVPVIPAVALKAGDTADAETIAGPIGLPLLLKSSAGGGGIGMREVHRQEDLAEAIIETREQALRQFGNADLLIEKYVAAGRHLEVQIVGDQHGKLIHLFERDCSTQRRRQKLLEEAPAAGLSDDLRSALQEAALQLAAAVNYHGVGTVEFLLDGDNFYLLEMNTRLQVEHGVTEAVCGLDLVELQLEVASGKPLALEQADISCNGHAIEARVYAENPATAFAPATGTITALSLPANPLVRVDSGVEAGSVVSHHYDGMLCKLIAHGDTREAATLTLQTALTELQLAGLQTNQQFLTAVLGSSDWTNGVTTTGVETDLDSFLSAAEPTTQQLNLALAAVTVWQFMHYPPAADGEPWPGAYKLPRQSIWSHAGRGTDVNWRWLGSHQFEFPELNLSAIVLEEGTDRNELVLEVSGQRLLFKIHESAAGLWLWQRQLGNLLLVPVHASNLETGGQQSGQCRSHGPGQVLRVLVSVDQRVEANQPLVVIESMKMESTLTAAQAGTVAEIAVSEGALIESDQLLVRLEPITENAS